MHLDHNIYKRAFLLYLLGDSIALEREGKKPENYSKDNKAFMNMLNRLYTATKEGTLLQPEFIFMLLLFGILDAVVLLYVITFATSRRTFETSRSVLFWLSFPYYNLILSGILSDLKAKVPVHYHGVSEVCELRQSHLLSPSLHHSG